MWRGIKDGECLCCAGEVRVPDVFWQIGDHEFVNGVLNVDAVGDAIVIKREVTIGGDGGDWSEDESRRRGVREDVGGSSSVKVIHNVIGGVGKLKLVDFEGHTIVAGRLRKGGSRE